MAKRLARIHVSRAALGPLPFAASMDWTGSYAAVLIGTLLLCLACGAGALAVKHLAL
jgi:hypothetical protein